ncbi:hypothetical protein JCM9140_1734 [Halalkalibacter wakoensis JCM 9140]|uniref:Uncharacterized protein n=1 Tax=Halalkalibacter wakoensis JCM 9140 TaxID=1236970 RepID=W4Q0W9_9BACI|nr:hypothetical protein JCM9140_1734 [Halalkalibacter wakoensis JCM 9140]
MGGALGALTYAALFERIIYSSLWVVLIVIFITLYICMKQENKSQIKLHHQTQETIAQ